MDMENTNEEKLLKPLEMEGQSYGLYDENGGLINRFKDNKAGCPQMALHIKSQRFIDQTPLSFDYYLQYCIATGKEEIPDDRNWGRKNMPAVNVSLLDTTEYCNWLNPRVPLEKALELMNRLLAIGANNHPLVQYIQEHQNHWIGFPPPYLVDRDSATFFMVPNAMWEDGQPFTLGYKLPDNNEWSYVKGDVEKLAAETSKSDYGHIHTDRNMPLRTKKPHSVNKLPVDQDPENLVWDVYGNVNEMGPVLTVMEDLKREREIADRYHNAFPEWKDITAPRFEAYWKRAYNLK